MCFVWCLTAGFTMRNIAAWLSMHNGIGSWMGKPTSPLMDLSQAACCPVLASPIYSASPTESATVFFHCDAQDIHPFTIKKTCPDVEWQSSLFSSQSESEYPINPAFEPPLYLMQSPLVPLRYLRTCFMCLTCVSDGLLLYCDSHVAANAMSGLVPMAAYIDQCPDHLLE